MSGQINPSAIGSVIGSALGQVGSSGLSGGLGNQKGLGGSVASFTDIKNWATTTTSTTDSTLTATSLNQMFNDVWNDTATTGTGPYQWQQYGNSIQLNPIPQQQLWKVPMGGHNEDYSKWWYDPATRQWDDGTGNKFNSLPVGITPDQTMLKKERQEEQFPTQMFSGTFSPKGYAKWFKKRLRYLYAA